MPSGSLSWYRRMKALGRKNMTEAVEEFHAMSLREKHLTSGESGAEVFEYARRYMRAQPYVSDVGDFMALDWAGKLRFARGDGRPRTLDSVQFARRYVGDVHALGDSGIKTHLLSAPR